jgi:hypothetical protein
LVSTNTEIKKNDSVVRIIRSNRDPNIIEPDRDDNIIPQVLPLESSYQDNLMIYLFKDGFYYEMSYPCELYVSCRFDLKNDSLKVYYSNTTTWRFKINYLNDTLTVTSIPEYGVRKFVRANLDASVVKTITRDSINSLCFEGRWLNDGFDSDGSMKPLEPDIDTPFDIPYDLEIKKENICKNRRVKKLNFTINGKKWNFKYYYRSDNILQLELLNWKKEDGSPLLLYYRKE